MRTGSVLPVLALLAVVGTTALAVQSLGSSLVLLATAASYPGETYTDGPLAPAEFVYFTDERLAFDVSVANWGRTSSTLDRSRVPRPLLRIAGLDGGADVAGGRILERVFKDGIGGVEVVEPAVAATIEASDGLRWRFLFEGGISRSGFYRVSSQFDAQDEKGESLRPQRPTFVIEIRARTSAQPAELARREAEWLTAVGDPGAYAATEALERAYPDSVAVHLIRGRLADAAGDVRGSRREMDVAAQFLRDDRDILFRRYARPGQIEDLIDSLRP